MASTYTIPQGYTKDELFSKPTPAELRRGAVLHGQRTLGGIVSDIETLRPWQSYRLDQGLLGDTTARARKKHGPVLDITYAPGETPRSKLELMIQLPLGGLSGYGWRGSGYDGRVRVVPLCNLLEGAKLFAYEARKAPDGPAANTKVYDETVQIFEQGGSAVVRVSSRTPRHPQYDVRLEGVPLEEGNDWRRVTTTSTCCKDNLYTGLRYDTPSDPARKTFCDHEIAAYWKVAAAVRHEHGTDLPLTQGPFPVPSQRFIDFYKKLDRVFVEERTPARMTRRLLNEAERETLLRAEARRLGPAAFGGKGKLANRDWT